MSAARAAILRRVARAQRTGWLPPAVAPRPLEPPEKSPEGLLARFRGELEALAVEVHVEATADDVRARVAEHVSGRRVLSWDPHLLPYGIGSLVADALLGSSPREQQAQAEIGLTGCDGAVAETGSLLLLSGKGRSRTVSLLPPVHLAVVKRDDLCFGMGELFRTHAEQLDRAACATFITGPSRTADIELALTLGVHGPGRVVVVIGP